jgi:hypothetical protein
MKIENINSAMPRLQTTNERLRTQHKMCLADSNDRPVTPSNVTSINVQFAPVSLLQLQIKHPMKTASPLSQTPFADLMMHPEKLEAALKKAKNENDAFAASRTFGQGEANRATPNASFKNNDDPAVINWAGIDNPTAVNQ